MAPHIVPQKPVIPGFIVERDAETGDLVATRIEPLTDYQAEFGCVDEVRVAGDRELEWLCMAERVKAELVARAEREMPGR